MAAQAAYHETGNDSRSTPVQRIIPRVGTSKDNVHNSSDRIVQINQSRTWSGSHGEPEGFRNVGTRLGFLMEKLNTSNAEAQDALLHAGHTKSLDVVLKPATANQQVDDPETDELRAQVQKELARTDRNITDAERNVRSAEAYVDRAKQNKSEKAERAHGNGSSTGSEARNASTTGKPSQAGSSSGQSSSKDSATSSASTTRSAADKKSQAGSSHGNGSSKDTAARNGSQDAENSHAQGSANVSRTSNASEAERSRNKPNDSHSGQGQEQQSASDALSLPWLVLLLVLAGS